MPIRAQAEESNDARSQAAHFAGEPNSAGREFGWGELCGAGGGASHEVCQAVT
jgi:hypothetical protein